MNSLICKFVFIVFMALGVFMQAPHVHAQNLSEAQARAMALEKVPGEIIDTARSLRNGAIVFQYEIAREDGTVMEIEIDSATHEVLRLEVNRSGEDGAFPETEIGMDQARKIAIAHIEGTTSGLRSVEVLQEEQGIFSGQFAYSFSLRRGIDHYEVIVAAHSGAVISSREKE